MITVLLGIIFLFLILSFRNSILIHSLRLELKQKEDENRILRFNNYLSKEIRNIQTDNISNQVKEAVKYAMKKSHPDNGGNQELFIKFRNIYKEITR